MNRGNDERRLYDDLAWLFPLTSAPEDYVDLVEGAYGLIRARVAGDLRDLLHLGAGAGHVDNSLQRHFSVTGIDVSEKMLAMAAELNPKVRYLLGDMRTVRLGRTFDAVLLDDAVEYMLTEDDLRAALQTAWVHLRPGGVAVVFPQVTRETFSQNNTTFSTRAKGGVELTLVRNDYDPDSGDTTFEGTLVYLIRRDGQLEIAIDRHLSGLFPLEDWRRLPREAGFSVEEVDPGTGLPLFICSRPAGTT